MSHPKQFAWKVWLQGGVWTWCVVVDRKLFLSGTHPDNGDGEYRSQLSIVNAVVLYNQQRRGAPTTGVGPTPQRARRSYVKPERHTPPPIHRPAPNLPPPSEPPPGPLKRHHPPITHPQDEPRRPKPKHRPDRPVRRGPARGRPVLPRPNFELKVGCVWCPCDRQGIYDGYCERHWQMVNG